MLRAQLRAARDAAPPTAIAAPAAYLDRIKQGLTVAAYLPLGSEADAAALVAAARVAGCRLALPHVVSRKAPLTFLAWDEGAALTSGPFGLRQPAAEADPAVPDIILTPLLGFDRRGYRLGQGAGHYDRAFAAHPAAWRIGIARAVQEVEMVPTDPWDVPLHAIVTEDEWIMVR